MHSHQQWISVTFPDIIESTWFILLILANVVRGRTVSLARLPTTCPCLQSPTLEEGTEHPQPGSLAYGHESRGQLWNSGCIFCSLDLLGMARTGKVICERECTIFQPLIPEDGCPWEVQSWERLGQLHEPDSPQDGQPKRSLSWKSSVPHP